MRNDTLTELYKYYEESQIKLEEANNKIKHLEELVEEAWYYGQQEDYDDAEDELLENEFNKWREVVSNRHTPPLPNTGS